MEQKNMNTLCIPFVDESSVQQAIRVLQAGGVIAFPTDTVYGVGSSAFDGEAIERLYVIKERSNLKAIPVLIGSADQLAQVTAQIPEYARWLIERLWPGALTVILPIHAGLPASLSPTPTVGVRMPDHVLLRRLITLAGPLAVTSANLSGMPNSVMAQDVLAQIGGRIELLLDGGPTPGEIPSTVVDCTGRQAHMLRLGRIAREELEAVLGESLVG